MYIPRIYDYDTSNFWESNKVGKALKGVLSCTVTEELNGEFYLEMTMETPSTPPMLGNRIVAPINTKARIEPFEICDMENTIDGLLHIRAWHMTYRYTRIVILPFSVTNKYIDDVGVIMSGMVTPTSERDSKNKVFYSHSDILTAHDFAVKEPQTVMETIRGKEGSLLDVYGGELYWHNASFSLWSRRGTDTNIILNYGTNITDFKRTWTMNTDDVYFAIVGYWKKNDVIVVGDAVEYAPSNTGAQSNYIRTKVVDLTGEFETQPTVAQLTTAADAYHTANAKSVFPMTVDVSFLPSETQKLELGDTLKLYYSPLGITADVRVIKTVYNVLADKYDSIVTGTSQVNMNDAIKKIAKSK